MARLDVKTQDPERYAQVKAEQEELKLQFSMAAFAPALRGSAHTVSIRSRFCIGGNMALREQSARTAVRK